MRFLRVRRQVAAVVGRPFLVAERLEPIFQVALERLVELVALHPQRFFVGVLAAADHALAQREHELPDAFLAELRFDELEHRVAEVVNQPRVARVAVAFHLGHLRDDVGHRRVANRHQVGRVPLAALVIRQTLVDPQRHAAADQRLRDDVELELVRQFVDDQAVEEIRRLVDRHHHPLSGRLGERQHAFLRGAGRHVLLLEFAVRLEQDQRHLRPGRQVVPQIGADLLVGALGVAGDPLQMLFDLRVVVDLEMVGGVDLPLEVVVVDVVLAEVGDVVGLSRCQGGVPGNQGKDSGQPGMRPGGRL